MGIQNALQNAPQTAAENNADSMAGSFCYSAQDHTYNLERQF